MLHHVGFREGDDAARLEGHHGHVHVVPEVRRVDEARRRPSALRVRHGRGLDVPVARDERRRAIEPCDLLVPFPDPHESCG